MASLCLMKHIRHYALNYKYMVFLFFMENITLEFKGIRHYSGNSKGYNTNDLCCIKTTLMYL